MKWRNTTGTVPSRDLVLLTRFCGVVTLHTRCSQCPGARPRQRPVAAVGARCRPPSLCVWLRGPRARRVPAGTERRPLPLSARSGAVGAEVPARSPGPVRGCPRGPRGAGRGRGSSAPPPRRCRSAVRCRRGRAGGAAAGRCGGLGRGGSERARLAAARARRPPALPGRTRGISLAMQTRRRLLLPEVSERRAAHRPRAGEAGLPRSPGPCRPQRGPAGGEGFGASAELPYRRQRPGPAGSGCPLAPPPLSSARHQGEGSGLPPALSDGRPGSRSPLPAVPLPLPGCRTG